MSEQLLERTNKPPVKSVAEFDFYEESQAEFQQWYGGLALENTVQLELRQPTANLTTNIEAANAGSVEALEMVRINVDTAVTEAVFKDRHIRRVYLERDSNGELVQFGQPNKTIQRNAIVERPNRHPLLKGITKAEAGNSFFIDSALQTAELVDNYFIVASIVPTGVPEKDLGHSGDGYFLTDLTLALQATTEQPDGRVTTDSAFMAGVEAGESKTFEERMKTRFDIRALQKVYEWLGQEPPETAQEFLENGLMIPKAKMPNGLTDFMRLYDLAAAEVLGHDVERNPERYEDIWEVSRQREASIQTVRDKVLERILAAGPTLKGRSPMLSITLLWKFVREYTVQDALTNRFIDPKVFGRGAEHIRMARIGYDSGNIALQHEAMRNAALYSEISGCGGGSGGRGGRNRQNESIDSLMEAILSGEQLDEEQLEKLFGKDDLGPMAFYCPDGHLNVRTEKNKQIPKCQHHGCRAKVKC
ncbi:MAG TPA: hypothetical protein VG604_01690 [Candidatus Saccharimonadales bacterium]|nr:hypothetical protein [Candidatus Saccharimonadales bacterium]